MHVQLCIRADTGLKLCLSLHLHNGQVCNYELFQKKKKQQYFLFKSFVKIVIIEMYAFTINMFTTAETAWKREFSYKNRCVFLLLVIICNPPKIKLFFNINAVVLIVIIY